MLKNLLNKLKAALTAAPSENIPQSRPAKAAKAEKSSSRPKSASKKASFEPGEKPASKKTSNKKKKKSSKRNSDTPKADVFSESDRDISREAVKKPEKLKEVPVCEGKVRFLDLPLREEIQFGIQHSEFEYCTPIQEMTLPVLLERRDLAGKAQTGTGKTAAFLLAGFDYLLNHPVPERKNGTPRMLVLAPTRELAMQIHKDAMELSVFTGLNCVVVFGGMDHERQRRDLAQRVDLLVGTPGRVIDYSRGPDLDLSKVETLVIDEADRMLDMGFIPDVKRIVSQLPRKGERQTLLFSATLEDHILRLASGWLAEPAVIESEPENLVSENITQTFYAVSRDEKLALLLYILANTPYDRVLIFGNRKDVNLRLQYDLARFGYRIPVLSGDIPQAKRIRILEQFRSGEEKIVIATDVAARGIHVDDVSIVVNYDLPERAEDYIHRIGRTGRAGHTGLSISFLCEYGAYYLPAIEELLGTTFPSSQPTEEMVTLPPELKNARLPELKRDRRGGGFGSRPRRPGYSGRSGHSGRRR